MTTKVKVFLNYIATQDCGKHVSSYCFNFVRIF